MVRWSKWQIAWDGKKTPPDGWITNDQLPCSQIQAKYSVNNIDIYLDALTNIWISRDYLTFHIGENYKTTAIFNVNIVGAEIFWVAWITSDSGMYYEWIQVRESDGQGGWSWLINKNFIQGGFVDFIWNKHLYTGAWNSRNEKSVWVAKLNAGESYYQSLDFNSAIPYNYVYTDTTTVTVNRISNVPKYRVIYTADNRITDNNISPITSTGLRQNCAEGLLAGEYLAFTSGKQAGETYTIIDNTSTGVLLLSGSSLSGNYTTQGKKNGTLIDNTFALHSSDTFTINSTHAWVNTAFLTNNGKFFPYGTISNIKDYDKDTDTTTVVLNVAYNVSLEIPYLTDGVVEKDLGIAIDEDTLYASTSATKSIILTFPTKEYSAGGQYEDSVGKYNMVSKTWSVVNLKRIGKNVVQTASGLEWKGILLGWVHTSATVGTYVVEAMVRGPLYDSQVPTGTKFEGYIYKLPNLATRTGAFYAGDQYSGYSMPITVLFTGDLMFDIANVTLPKDSRVVLDRYWSPRGIVVSKYSPSGCRFFTRAVSGLASTQIIPTIDCFNYLVVYIKNNNIYATKVFYSKSLKKEEPKEYQITFDGGYSSPSVVQLTDTSFIIGFNKGGQIGYIPMETGFDYDKTTKTTNTVVTKIADNGTIELDGNNPKFRYDKSSRTIWLSYQKGSDNYLAKSSWDTALKQYTFEETNSAPIFSASVPSELKYDSKINQVSLTNIFEKKPYTYVSADRGGTFDDPVETIPVDYVKVERLKQGILKDFVVSGIQTENQLQSIFSLVDLKVQKPQGNDANLTKEYNDFITEFITFLNSIVSQYKDEEYLQLTAFNSYLVNPTSYFSSITITFEEMSSVLDEGISNLSAEPIFFWGKLSDKSGMWIYDKGRFVCAFIKEITQQEAGMASHPSSNQKFFSYSEGTKIKIAKSGDGGSTFIDI